MEQRKLIGRRSAMAGGLLLGGLGATGTRAAGSPVTITFAGAPGGLLHWFPVYVARGRRFFEEEGIALDWADLDSGTAQLASIMGGSCQMGSMGMEHVVTSGIEGADLVACANLFDVYPYSLTLSDAAIRKTGITAALPIDERIRRLAGLTIGISGPGGSSDVWMRNLLTDRGMDPDRAIRLQPVGNPGAMLAALSRSVVDGVAMSAPVDTIAEARGYGHNVIDPFNETIPELRNVPYSGLLARRSYVQAHPDVILAAVRAVTRAIRYAHEQPEGTVEAVRPFVLNADPAVVGAMIEKYRKGCARTPVLSRTQFEATVRWVNIGRDTPITVDMAAAVYPDAARAAADALLPKAG